MTEDEKKPLSAVQRRIWVVIARLAAKNREIEWLYDRIIELEIECGAMDLSEASLEKLIKE